MIQRDGTRKKLYKASKLWVVPTLFAVALSGVTVAQPASAATRRQTATKKTIATATSAAKIAKYVSLQSAATNGKTAQIVSQATSATTVATSASAMATKQVADISNRQKVLKLFVKKEGGLQVCRNIRC